MKKKAFAIVFASAVLLPAGAGLWFFGRSIPWQSAPFLSPAHTRAESAVGDLRRMLKEAIGRYRSLDDYTAIFYKEERSGGKWEPEEEIYFKFEKPFKIYMEWLNTRKIGVQVFYERGFHGNQLAVHLPGFLFQLKPVLFLDRDSPWVREGSAAYDIEDAGIGKFLLDLTRAVGRGAARRKLLVKYFEKEKDGQSVDITFPHSSPNEGFFAYRVIVFFDDETKLPLRMELFDWHNEPMGVYGYKNLKLNAGPADPEFKRRIHGRLFRIYAHT
ncbi:MAG: DUF1571 domain-containing protein [Candidatus Omnitrophica bacterium]|nr:DUF1571 domain-containing protein [Candidatus Omnitrophota bacterium]